MIAENLKKKESNVAKESFITRTREYKRDLQVCLNCLGLVWGVFKIASVMPYLYRGLPWSGDFYAICATCAKYLHLALENFKA